MAKRSQIQIALDKINAEIDELIKVRSRLEAVNVGNYKPKRERKAKPVAPATMVERELVSR